jgi:predicted RNase H-like HicB family nuclease
MSITHHSTITVHGKPYRAVLEEGLHNWSAYVPALPGLAVTGGNREETKARLREGIAFHLEGLERQQQRRGLAPAQRAAERSYGR